MSSLVPPSVPEDSIVFLVPSAIGSHSLLCSTPVFLHGIPVGSLIRCRVPFLLLDRCTVHLLVPYLKLLLVWLPEPTFPS